MADNIKLSDIARNVTEVNLRYSASVLNLAKDYLQVMKDAVMVVPDEDEAGANIKRPAASAPLLVAGRKGEIANAALSVNNKAGRDGKVMVTCRGDFGRAKVWADPETLEIKNGTQATVRVMAKIDTSLPVDEDVPGDLFIPELNKKIADFVVRRLPDAPAPRKTAAKKKTTRKKK